MLPRYKVEKVRRFSIFLFSLFVLLNCLFFTRAVVDFTLVPRFVFLSFFILSLVVFISFFLKDFKVEVDIIMLAYLAFALHALISISWSVNFSLAITEASKIILYFFLFSGTYILLQHFGDELISILLKTILLLFFISSIVVFLQMLELPEISRNYLYNIPGISGHKNLYSSFIFLCSVLSCLGFYKLKSYWKYISAFAIIFQLVLIIILQTRAAWLGYSVFFISGFFLFLIREKIKVFGYKYYLGAAISSLILINIFFLFALPQLLSLYNSQKPHPDNITEITDINTISERVLIWQKTYEVFKSNPILGCGANNWQICFPASSVPDIYKVQDLNVSFQRPHNDFLWILSEYGLIGFNLYFIFIISILTLLFIKLSGRFDITLVLLIAGILGYLTISFFDFPKERVEHNILFSIMLALSCFFIRKESPSFNKAFFCVPASAFKVSVPIFLSIFYISLLNFKGEYFTNKMYHERLNNNNQAVISLCDKAQSVCYTLDATSVPLSWYRGTANANLRNYQAALNDFRIASRMHPYNHHVLNDLASSYFMNEQIDSAKIFYAESARINPRFDEPRLNLTAIFINEGNLKEARKWNESVFHDSERKKQYEGIINN